MTKPQIIGRLLQEGHITEKEADVIRDQFKLTYQVQWVPKVDSDGWPMPGGMFRKRKDAELSAHRDYPFHETWVEEKWVHPAYYAILPT